MHFIILSGVILLLAQSCKLPNGVLKGLKLFKHNVWDSTKIKNALQIPHHSHIYWLID